MAPLTVLRLRTTDLPLVERQLRVKIAQLPQMFLDAPVLLDLGLLGEEGGAVDFPDLLRRLRSCKLVPVAVANVGDDVRPRAVEAGLGVLAATNARPRPDARPRAPAADAVADDQVFPPRSPDPAAARHRAPAPTPAPMPMPHVGPVVVSQPVRSGQVVYAQNADLVVLAPVNPGAQVLADGHIHIYAPLRGRAVAGMQGLLGARIFCQRLEAELIAISGAYVMAEDIPQDRRGRAAQIYLEGGECRIAPL
jgi:septum site-determining protein MinC